jgi:hypothetical protein
VFDRYRADSNYRPLGLAEWTKQYQVDPTELKSSVKANNPKTPVPD